MTCELVGGPLDGTVLGVPDEAREQTVDTVVHPCGLALRRHYYWTPAVSQRGHQVFLYHSAYELVEV